ncbi:MAG: hypothetical protein EAZ35_02325 [Sphingobacteriia bacterium]|nr:MAG: hypothetical protein EAZ35_02325 [Sphingobacteriia bacterium]
MNNLSTIQRKVIKIIRAGGSIRVMNVTFYKYRLMDSNKNPIAPIHARTINALINKQLLTKQSDGTFSSI